MENALKAIAGSVAYVKYYARPLSQSLLFPFILLAILISIIFVPGVPTQVVHAIQIIQWIPLTLIAITTHRMIIDGPNSVPEWGIVRFRLREIKFIAYGLLMVMMALPLMVLLFIPTVGVFLAFFLFMYFFCRLSLVFPSIAVDRPISLKESWQKTKNHQVMMLVAVGIFPLILLTILLVILSIMVGLLSSVPGLLWISVLISSLAAIMSVASALSVSFKIILEIENAL